MCACIWLCVRSLPNIFKILEVQIFLTGKTKYVLEYLMDFHYWSSTDQSLQICKDEHTHLLIVKKKNTKGLLWKKADLCPHFHTFFLVNWNNAHLLLFKNTLGSFIYIVVNIGLQMCSRTLVVGECVFAYELWGTLGFRAFLPNGAGWRKGRTSGPHWGYCRDKDYDGKEKPKNKREGSPNFDEALILEATWQLDIFQSVGIDFSKSYTCCVAQSSKQHCDHLWDNDEQAHYTARGRSLTQSLESKLEAGPITAR